MGSQPAHLAQVSGPAQTGLRAPRAGRGVLVAPVSAVDPRWFIWGSLVALLLPVPG